MATTPATASPIARDDKAFEEAKVLSAHSKLKESKFGPLPPIPSHSEDIWTFPVHEKFQVDENGEFCLKDFLEAANLCPDSFRVENISSKWRAVFAPVATSPLDALIHSHNRSPFFSAHTGVTEKINDYLGDRGVEHCIKSGDFEFSKPKLGMIGGWGRPNSDVVNADSLALIESVQEVLSCAPELPLNLQMFHRPPIPQVDPSKFDEARVEPTPKSKTSTPVRRSTGRPGNKKGLKAPPKPVQPATKNTTKGSMTQNAHAATSSADEAFPILAEKITWPLHEAFDFDFRNSMGGPNRNDAENGTPATGMRNAPSAAAAAASSKLAEADEIGDLFGDSDTVVEKQTTVCQKIRQQERDGRRAAHDNTTGVICDNATRFSRRGAITWWHLDDGGEFVTQQAITCPIEDTLAMDYNGRTSTFLHREHPLPNRMTASPIVTGPHGNPIMKMFFYIPREAYDFVTQDFETAQSFAFHSLDPLNTRDDELPENLPLITVALLESGGMALTSPPNIPHIVYTMQTCIMTEQRRISKLFLDESDYFAERATNWKAAPPHFYKFLTNSLKDDIYAQQHVVLPLISIVIDPYTFFTPVEPACDQIQELPWSKATQAPLNNGTHFGLNGLREESATEEQKDYVALLRLRAYLSLRSLFSAPKDQLADLPKSSRFLIERVLAKYPLKDPPFELSLGVRDRLNHVAENVAPTRSRVTNVANNVHSFGAGDSETYAAYVHVACQPRWGPSRNSKNDALKDARIIDQAIRRLGGIAEATDEELVIKEAELIKVIHGLHTNSATD